MKKRIAAAAALAAALILLVCAPAAPAARRIEAEPRDGEETPLPRSLRELSDLTVALRDGVVCVLDAEGRIVFRTDISEKSLSASDKALLERGVGAENYAALIRILESYGP